METRPGITVIGSSNTDMVIMTSHFPAPGETILGGDFLMNAGGKGANQAVAAARCGGKVSFIGKIGDDIFGRSALENIRNEGIDTSGLVTDAEAASGVAQIIVNSEGENSIVVAPGANLKLNRDDIDNAYAKFGLGEIILMQLEIPVDTILYTAKKASALGKKVILNPAPATTLPDDLYKCLYLITPNETETEQLTGVKVSNIQSAEKAAKIFTDKGVENVIITLGEKGAYVYSAALNEIVPSYQVKAVDTTAAGDCFNGVLAVGLANGKDLLESVRFANRAASLAVTRAGAQVSLPTRKEVEASL